MENGVTVHFIVHAASRPLAPVASGYALRRATDNQVLYIRDEVQVTLTHVLQRVEQLFKGVARRLRGITWGNFAI